MQEADVLYKKPKKTFIDKSFGIQISGEFTAWIMIRVPTICYEFVFGKLWWRFFIINFRRSAYKEWEDSLRRMRWNGTNDSTDIISLFNIPVYIINSFFCINTSCRGKTPIVTCIRISEYFSGQLCMREEHLRVQWIVRLHKKSQRLVPLQH